jgi:hypothetical protein
MNINPQNGSLSVSISPIVFVLQAILKKSLQVFIFRGIIDT